jgi:hypothetical protein
MNLNKPYKPNKSKSTPKPKEPDNPHFPADNSHFPADNSHLTTRISLLTTRISLLTCFLFAARRKSHNNWR